MIERFSVVIASPFHRERAIARIFQAALRGQIALIKTPTTPRSQRVRSVIVADAKNDEWVEYVMELAPERVIGFYELRGDDKYALLEAIDQDIKEAAGAATVA